MSEIAQIIKDGAQRIGKSLGEDAGRAVKKLYHQTGDNLDRVVKNHVENDAKHADDLRRLHRGEETEHAPKSPHSPGGGQGGGRGGSGNGHSSTPASPNKPAPGSRKPKLDGIGPARNQAEKPHESSRNEDSICPGGEPVDMATGRMFIEQLDVSLPGALPLQVTRSFESGYQAGRWMGPRWVSSFDERLEADQDGVVHLGRDRSAQAYPLPQAGGPPARPEAGPRRELRLLADGSRYRLTDRGLGLVREFTPLAGSSTALLTLVRDRSGNRIEFEWDEDGAPVAVTHSGGYRLLVTTERGRVTALRLAGADQDGHDVLLARYGYQDGHLASVYNSSGKALRFANDASGRITSWTDRNGTAYHYRYDGRGRVVDQEGSDGSLVFRFAYGDPDPETGIRVHTETDGLGHSTEYHVDERAQIVAQVDPLGNTTRFERDEHHRLIGRTDPLGRTTRFEYDAAGDLAEVVHPDGERSTAYYLDGSSLPVEITEPGGAVWLQEYDEAGRRIALTDPSGAVTRYGYDRAGHLASITDPIGRTTRVRCDAAGLPVEVSDPDGATARYRRDAFGRVVELTDPAGGVTRVGWNTEGRVTSLTDTEGNTERWQYDAEGNVVSYSDRMGRIRRYEYTPFETLAAVVEPDGSRLEYAYDNRMRLVAVTDGEGRSWRYTYDPAGRLVAETDFHGRTVAYEVDAVGRMTARTNAEGQRVSFAYDRSGNLVAKDVDGAVTEYQYRADGLLVRATGPDTELARTLDPLGNLLSETVDGRVLRHTRDALGRSTTRRTPAGHTSSWSYDEAGRRTALTTSAGSLAFRYDEGGREVERSFGERLTVASRWDAGHRLAAQTVRTPDSVLQQRAWSYTESGEVTGLEDLLAGPRRFELDPVGRITAVSAEGWSERYAYDPAGNLTEAHWPAGENTREAVGEREFSDGLLVGAGRVRYEYDAAGRVVLRQVTRLSRKPDTWRYTWDAEDRLTEVSTPDGTRWRYRYDPFGRRTAKVRLAEDGVTEAERTEFTWDGSVLIEQTTRAEYLPAPHTLSWDHRGLQPLCQTESVRGGNGDGAGARQDEVDRRFFAIVTDLVGMPTELVDAESEEVVWRATQTVWGNLTWPAKSSGYTPLRFPGQYFDPETRLHYNLNRYYDPETARYTSPDPLGIAPGPDCHGYVSNPMVLCDPLGLAPADPDELLKKDLMDLAKARVKHIGDTLPEGERMPGAFAVGKDRTTGKVYYGESGPEHDHAQAVQDALPGESRMPNGRPPGVCAEPRMFTNAIRDGADPKNLDIVTVNDRGKKFKMCKNCASWVPDFTGKVLTG